MKAEDRELIDSYIARKGVTKVPEGHAIYKEVRPFRNKKARLLFERHERTRQMYRDLIAYGFDKWEIAEMMQVQEQSVRHAARILGMTQELKGYGKCHTQ